MAVVIAVDWLCKMHPEYKSLNHPVPAAYMTARRSQLPEITQLTCFRHEPELPKSRLVSMWASNRLVVKYSIFVQSEWHRVDFSEVLKQVLSVLTMARIGEDKGTMYRVKRIRLFWQRAPKLV